MDAISSLNPATFGEYLKRTQNTICGRNPISVILYVNILFRYSFIDYLGMIIFHSNG